MDHPASDARHILLLADRDWDHPQSGGSGANLHAQVSRWVDWGHRVTVVAGAYPGCVAHERIGPQLTVHRRGGRGTVFPWTWAKLARGVGRDADVVLEVINGICYLTPLLLRRRPVVALVHHVHDDLYVGEFGRLAGTALHWLLERLPLRLLYRRTPFLTISEAAAADLVRVGIPRDHVTVEYLGVDPGEYRRTARAPAPRLLYLGRLKAYKRIEQVLDVLEAIPEATLDIAGDGDHRDVLETEVAERGLSDRVVMHGWVDPAEKARLYGEAWVALTASSSEGWSLTVMEAALCGTPSAALAVGGLRESIVDGETGILADTPMELAARIRALVDDPAERERLGDAAEARARGFTWDRTAERNLAVIARAAGRPLAARPAAAEAGRGSVAA